MLLKVEKLNNNNCQRLQKIYEEMLCEMPFDICIIIIMLNVNMQGIV